MRSPYDESEELVAMPALGLDVAIIHANRADVRGNGQYLGPDWFFDDLFCMAATKRFMSCERIVDTADLLKEAEGALLGELREQVFSGGRIPRLLLAPTKVKTMRLSAPERYLLSRFDGKRELRSIVQVSPIRELDALKYVRQFVDAGLVELKGA